MPYPFDRRTRSAHNSLGIRTENGERPTISATLADTLGRVNEGLNSARPSSQFLMHDHDFRHFFCTRGP